MKDTSNIALTVVIALAVGAIGFFAGTHVAARRFAVAWGNMQPVASRRLGYGGMINGHPTSTFTGRLGRGMQGKVTAVKGNTVTVTQPNGTTRDLTLSDKTVVETIVKGTTADLKVGATIMVSGGGFWNNTQTVIVRPQ